MAISLSSLLEPSGSAEPKTEVITAIPSTPVSKTSLAFSFVIPPIAKMGISVIRAFASTNVEKGVGFLPGFVGVS